MTEYRDNNSNRKERPKWLLICLNLLLMTVIAVLLGWLALSWLDIWTGHGKESVVPDVKGMQFGAAETRLIDEGFIVEIADSVYDNRVKPGVVVDQNPRQNTRVKPGRLIYLTINAFSPKTVTVPRLTDISKRQARAILAGLGIKNVVEDTVISEFKDLVLGARCNGHRLMAGARVPVNSRIVLEVGDGMPGYDEDADTLADKTPEPVEKVDLF